MDFSKVLFFKNVGANVAYSGKDWEALFAASSGGGWAETTITGTPPLTYKALGQPLKDYLISGNTVQNGTPTPSNPVDVVGCGIWDETQQSYKLPLTVNGTEHPIYLGQVETTRKIKKLVLTGEEGWSITSNGVLRIGLSGQLRPSTPLSTHYSGSNATAWSNVPDKSVSVSISGYLAILDTTYTTVADFKSYLADQYAAGTPVTIWYVLATPETAIVNETLHKIGDYADTVSFAQAGVTIPTVAGANTLTVDTTVQPSKVSITGNIKEVPT